jgi:hypothetical protein
MKACIDCKAPLKENKYTCQTEINNFIPVDKKSNGN